MKKKILKKVTALLLIVVLALTLAISAFAADRSFTMLGYTGKVSLTRDSASGTGKTYFPIYPSAAVTRNVSVTLYYTKNGTSFNRTASAQAVTTPFSGDTTASITIYVPDSTYSTTSAKSSHECYTGSTRYTDALNA